MTKGHKRAAPNRSSEPVDGYRRRKRWKARRAEHLGGGDGHLGVKNPHAQQQGWFGTMIRGIQNPEEERVGWGVCGVVWLVWLCCGRLR